MGQWWGSRLGESYGGTCPPDWCDVIDRTDDARLDRALKRLRMDTPVYPPTLGQLEAAIPPREKRRAPEPTFSRWAVRGNQILFQLAYCDRRRGRAMRSISTALPEAIAAKNEIVALAERDEANGQPWDVTDFNSVVLEALEGALGTPEHAPAELELEA